jgi:hypothetical protein
MFSTVPFCWAQLCERVHIRAGAQIIKNVAIGTEQRILPRNPMADIGGTADMARPRLE